MRYNIYDVAKKAGVSTVTVSKVINDVKTVRESNRQKVLQVMKELNYHPSAAARSLARGKTGVIGLVTLTIKDPFLSDVAEAVNGYMENQGYFLAMSVLMRDSGDGESKHPYLFQEDRVDGLLILSPAYEKEYILELKGKNIPFVLMDSQHQHVSVPSIVVDNYKGGYNATQHLIELGHKNIAYVGGPTFFLSSRERERGYRDALKNAGLEPYNIDNGLFWVDTGYDIMQKWIKENKLPTAIFAGDDHIAFGVINALHYAGLHVPDDISVVGCDDHPFASVLHPHLTTVKQPSEEMGAKGAEMLIKIIKGELKRFSTVKLEPKLIVRESSAPPKK